MQIAMNENMVNKWCMTKTTVQIVYNLFKILGKIQSGFN